jgi:hypothetical protein
MNLPNPGYRFILIHEGGAIKYTVSSATGVNQIHNLAPRFSVAFDVALSDYQ